jgi:hypothetical protein
MISTRHPHVQKSAETKRERQRERERERERERAENPAPMNPPLHHRANSGELSERADAPPFCDTAAQPGHAAPPQLSHRSRRPPSGEQSPAQPAQCGPAAACVAHGQPPKIPLTLSPPLSPFLTLSRSLSVAPYHTQAQRTDGISAPERLRCTDSIRPLTGQRGTGQRGSAARALALSRVPSQRGMLSYRTYPYIIYIYTLTYSLTYGLIPHFYDLNNLPSPLRPSLFPFDALPSLPHPPEVRQTARTGAGRISGPVHTPGNWRPPATPPCVITA